MQKNIDFLTTCSCITSTYNSFRYMYNYSHITIERGEWNLRMFCTACKLFLVLNVHFFPKRFKINKFSLLVRIRYMFHNTFCRSLSLSKKKNLWLKNPHQKKALGDNILCSLWCMHKKIRKFDNNFNFPKDVFFSLNFTFCWVQTVWPVIGCWFKTLIAHIILVRFHKLLLVFRLWVVVG